MFRTDSSLPRWLAVTLSLVPFVLLAAAYFTGSYYRHLRNPQDKVLPSISKLIEGAQRVAVEKDRDGEIRLWVDTKASVLRFAVALAIVSLGILLGLYMGLFPIVEALCYRFLVFFDKIPALSILPILFILFGLGELSKTMLIVIGVLPTIALDAYLKTKEIPRELVQKAQSLGATEQEIALRIALPQIFPRMLDSLRLNFKSMMLLLIAGESLAASVGLGYRIFVVRRYVAMEIILPYVLWMTLLLFAADWAVSWYIRRRYSWVAGAAQ